MGTPVWQLLAKLDRIHERQIARQGRTNRCREGAAEWRRDDFAPAFGRNEHRLMDGQPESSEEVALEKHRV